MPLHRVSGPHAPPNNLPRVSELCSQVLVEVGEEIERLLRAVAGERSSPTLLDVGCWDGELSARCGAALGAGRMLGVEVYEGPAVEAEAKGLAVARVDLETGQLPW